MADFYIALLHPPVDGSAWGVTFPDLPGLTSAGDSFEDAHGKAREALAGHVAALIADGDPVPAPRRFEDLLRDPEYLDEVNGQPPATAALIPLLDLPAPKERINITMDRGVLRRIDEVAQAEGVSRSAFIERASKSWVVSVSYSTAISGMREGLGPVQSDGRPSGETIVLERRSSRKEA